MSDSYKGKGIKNEFSRLKVIPSQPLKIFKTTKGDLETFVSNQNLDGYHPPLGSHKYNIMSFSNTP